MKDFLQLATDRYSVRKFNDTKVEQEKIDKILEAAKVAPTALNYQPQKIYVLESEEAIEKINSLSKCIYGAKTVFMIAYDDDRDWNNELEEGSHSGQQDASIVATHMMLEAWDLGVASCWVNMFPNTKTAEAFGLPENIKPVLLLPIGYAAEDAKPAPFHTNYREMDDMVTKL